MLIVKIDDGLNSIVLNWEHHSVDIMELSKKIEEVCYREFHQTKRQVTKVNVVLYLGTPCSKVVDGRNFRRASRRRVRVYRLKTF